MFLRTWYDLFQEEWMTIKELVTYISDDEDPDPAGSAGSCEHLSLFEALPETLQTAFKGKPQSFRIRLGRALEKWVDACFGEENLRLERMMNAHQKTGSWRVMRGVAGVVPVQSTQNSEKDITYI